MIYTCTSILYITACQDVTPPLSHVKTHILLNSINNYLTSGGSPFKDTYTSIVYIATPSTPTFIHGYDIHIAFLKVGCLLGISYQEITVNGMKQLCTKFRMNLRDYDSNKVRWRRFYHDSYHLVVEFTSTFSFSDYCRQGLRVRSLLICGKVQPCILSLVVSCGSSLILYGNSSITIGKCLPDVSF
jgi:hypothetical protein